MLLCSPYIRIYNRVLRETEFFTFVKQQSMRSKHSNNGQELGLARLNNAILLVATGEIEKPFAIAENKLIINNSLSSSFMANHFTSSGKMAWQCTKTTTAELCV